MHEVAYRRWRLAVDQAATTAAHASYASGGPEACGCLVCQNFAAVRHLAYPLEFRALLDELRIPFDRESEVCHYDEVEPGVHFYGGWFHFVGSILAGPDAKPGGSVIDLVDVTNTFALGFTRDNAVVPFDFQPGTVIQLEFSAKVPWVLDEPYSGDIG